MSKGKKLVVLVILLVVSTIAFEACRRAGVREAAAFFAVATVGLLVATVGTAASRPGRRGRR